MGILEETGPYALDLAVQRPSSNTADVQLCAGS